jgi:hypothetical protein
VTADWPDDSDTVAEAKEHPGVFAQKGVGDIADHVQAVIDLAKGGPSGDRRALRDRDRASPAARACFDITRP